MPPPLLYNVLPAALPAHCEPSSPFLTAVSSYLHICLPTPLALISSILGTLSIISWLFAQLPQIYKNHQLQSTSGLSLFFLIEWCLGDTGNLVGALLTRQAAWQVIVAGYYVLVDVTLVFQFFWYTHYKSRRAVYRGYTHPHHGNDTGAVLEGVSMSEEDSVNDLASFKATKQDTSSTGKDAELPKRSSPLAMDRQTSLYTNEKLSSSRRTITRSASGPSLPLVSTRTLLLASMLCAVAANAQPTEPNITPIAAQRTTVEIIGRVASWASTVLYLGSRPPQLYKNYRRKSTAGLSPLLFMAAFCGNLFYSASLATNPNAWSDFPPYGGGGWAGADGNNRLEWVGLSIPFFLGAFGVLFLDGCMGLQFLLYGSNDQEEVVRVEDSERGSRWTRVRGWMRGWIPSVSPTRGYLSNATAQESQALLRGGEHGQYGAV
ncbi:PQ-loop repeat-containing protein [Aspergillus clavatus NRRL 1]|uniref:PQ loop repeat protein n=1 Tax=Aspergillus clavatus (strain ATCC 1007 / CBS 513.65 / DSM 816 / NCTC 3887 / NRRL 1 / QM 1276 / 107) TaxID=344612 RepID=A1CPT5_ASPCL|nr:PQ loop repeat protein [Aspergillus clavatus NRRL 1]EAW07656.1 PQ loop repeat protein [Aspergillus clavatus NRRL 1]